MHPLTGPEMTDIELYARFGLALVFVISLFMLVAFILRRLGLGTVAAGAGRQRRLAIVEVMPIDGRRRLVLVRRDDAEHLLLLGTTGDVVVESSIRVAPMPGTPAGTEGKTP
jgi:flagellar protein FliO/FliZ